jgi:hypothetical protein
VLVPQVAPNEVADVTINFGAGVLNLAGGGGAEFLARGTATTNIEEIRPEITIEGTSIRIDQGQIDYDLTGLPNFNQIKNRWELNFSDRPMALQVRAGAFDGHFDFGGFALTSLNIFTGASSVDVLFSEPNHADMDIFRFNTGASSVYLGKLANARVERLEFKGGAGSYELDFFGALSGDMIVNIDAALSTLEIRVPEGVPATVNITSGFAAVNTRGAWSGSGDLFTQPGEGYGITFNINLGAGNLDLEN